MYKILLVSLFGDGFVNYSECESNKTIYLNVCSRSLKVIYSERGKE